MIPLHSNASNCVCAPAKLNLFLEVRRRRADGFHEIETVISAINVCDRVSFTATRPREPINLVCRWAAGLQSSRNSALWPPLPPAENNLVHRAVTLLRERAGAEMGADIAVVKRIPAEAGLGGASSDAAAALLAANSAWRLGWNREQLAELSAELGSDIPFFFGAGAAVCAGRGEQIRAIQAPQLHVVVVKPPAGLATATVYQRCRPADQPRTSVDLQECLRRGDAAAAAAGLFNRLEDPARELSPWISRLCDEFDRVGCLGRRMSGSGTSYFGVFRNARQARRAAGYLRSRNLGAVFSATTIPSAAV
ncbi:MAG: 4-(cytidine 5'-diphospho)-2-C-methyl-D-erythritol kinase [Pirellulaceae bacterium]|jgi:4-diphosphocytidyl-2-C-methyl-D-erythritol kinase|nr:4-(cytidine 5'-diphospho)-2-C-methyl-D-erythritol kinase [Pirellulaceae bacterium]MDP7018074.1 4-(cytidine 5'-diphospho)-2-C-methyl-D-erythritol kinase [Pirellulaceae bacterium]